MRWLAWVGLAWAKPEMAGPELLTDLDAGLASRNLSKIQAVLMSIANSNSSNSSDDGTVENMLSDVDDIVNNTLQPSVKSDFHVAQSELSGFYELFLRCEEEQLSNFKDSVTVQRAVAAGTEEHNACRRQQVISLDEKLSCETLLNASVTAKEAKCQLFHSTARVPDISVCNAAMDEDVEAFHERKIKEFRHGLDLLLERQKGCQEANLQVKDQQGACALTGEHFADQKAACDRKQLEVDTAVCRLQRRMGTNCAAYNACRAQAMVSFSEANESAKMTEAELQTTWKMLEQVRCMIDGAKQRDPHRVALCSDKTHFSVAHLTLNYTGTPPMAPCQALSESPGGAEYMQELYGHLPEQAPASPCQAACCLEI
ncbi:unnamed protein product [Effrenium voratum]|nr:unnamed protein product [Effrenium voratum]|mmetsp:Transcript_7562/g.18133  ORF Transcript_7562/g.18133 Transcript_7562/m.18133 type:complete len:371 (+) Transcript_7562:64-1176(+)